MEKTICPRTRLLSYVMLIPDLIALVISSVNVELFSKHIMLFISHPILFSFEENTVPLQFSSSMMYGVNIANT